MKKMVLGFVILCGLISCNLFASDNTRARVIYVGTWGNGGVFIRLNTIVNEPECNNNEIWVDKSNPAVTNILSLAMTAYTADLFVHVKTKGCINEYPTLDVNESFFHLGPR